MSTEYITLEDWGKRYGKVRRTYYNWQKQFDFPKPVRMGKKLYFNLRELREFEAKFADRFGAVEAAA